jgi:hypothetical protein
MLAGQLRAQMLHGHRQHADGGPQRDLVPANMHPVLKSALIGSSLPQPGFKYM